MPKIVRMAFALIGFLLIGFSLFTLSKRNDPQKLQFENNYSVEGGNTSAPTKKSVSGIEIAAIGLSLPVMPAQKTGDKWDTTSKGVSYLASTPIPGDSGNSIMYGHNWRSILGNLHHVRSGNIIKVYFSNRETKEFKVVSVSEVAPSDNSKLMPTESSTLTIYTCSGFFDQRRLVVTSVLI